MFYKYKNKAAFERDLNNGLKDGSTINSRTAIAFIENPKCIWTHGTYWFCYDESLIITENDVLRIVTRVMEDMTNPWGSSPWSGTSQTDIPDDSITSEQIQNGTIRLEDLSQEVINQFSEEEISNEEVEDIWGAAMDAARNVA